MRHGFGATTYTCSASGRCARTACAPRPTRTIRPCAAASAITRSVSWTIAASSGSTRGTPAVAMNISGDPAARVRARRSNSPGARSSRWATASGGSPARRATSSTNPVALRLDLLLLRDLVVDRLHHLGRGLQVTEKEGRHRRDPEVPAAGAGPRHEGGVDQPLHRVRDLGALGDVVDRVLHHAVAHALADGVEHGTADLVFVADLGEDLGRLHRVDLPADRHFDVHA